MFSTALKHDETRDYIHKFFHSKTSYLSGMLASHSEYFLFKARTLRASGLRVTAAAAPPFTGSRFPSASNPSDLIRLLTKNST